MSMPLSLWQAGSWSPEAGAQAFLHSPPDATPERYANGKGWQKEKNYLAHIRPSGW